MNLWLHHHVRVENDVNRALVKSYRVPVRKRRCPASVIRSAPVPDAEERNAAEPDGDGRVRLGDALGDEQRHIRIADESGLSGFARATKSRVNIEQHCTARLHLIFSQLATLVQPGNVGTLRQCVESRSPFASPRVISWRRIQVDWRNSKGCKPCASAAVH